MGAGDAIREAWEQLVLLVRAYGSYAKPEDPALLDLNKSIDLLASSSPFSASVLWAGLHHLAGDVRSFELWSERASKEAKPSDLEQLALVRATFLANLGLFSHAGLLLRTSFTDSSNTEEYADVGLRCGAFFADEPVVSGIDLAHVEDDASPISIARRCLMVLAKLGLKEEQLRPFLDIAGEVMRERGLLLKGRAPLIRTLDEEDEVSMLVQYQVDLSPKEAAVLTREVAKRAARAGASLYGVSFSFLPRVE